MDVSQEEYIKSTFDLTGDKQDDTFIDEFMAAVSTTNCVRSGNRSDIAMKFVLKPFDAACAESGIYYQQPPQQAKRIFHHLFLGIF